MSTMLDTSFLPAIIADAATNLVTDAVDVLYALSGVEFTPHVQEALRALESSVGDAMSAAHEAAENYTQYIAAVEAEREDEENESLNSDIDYALDYYEMLD